MIKTFVLACIVMFAPLLFILSLLFPDRMEMQVSSPGDFRVQLYLDASDSCRSEIWGRATGKMMDLAMWMPHVYAKQNLRVKVCSEAHEIIVQNIKIRKCLIFTCPVELESVKLVGSGHLDRAERVLKLASLGDDSFLHFNSNGVNLWSIMVDNFVLLSGLIIGAVIILVAVIMWNRKWKVELQKKDLYVGLAFASLFALYFSVIVPLQTFLSNQNLFEYGIFDLLTGFFTCFLLLVAWVWSFEKLIGRSAIPLLFSFLVYEYLQTGVLTIGAPRLEGNMGFYRIGVRAFLDVCVLVGLLFASWRCSKFILKYGQWICLAFFVLMISSLLDVHSVATSPRQDKDVAGLYRHKAVVDSARYSDRKNVFVFVVDCVSTKLAMDVVREGGYAHDLAGFVAYTNNVGMHSYTLLGAPSIATGTYYDESIYGRSLSKELEFADCSFGKMSHLTPYVECGFPSYALFGGTNKGFTNKLVAMPEDRALDVTDVPCAFKRCGEQQNWNLNEIIAFRLAPFYLKKYLYAAFASIWMSGKQMDSEAVLFEELKRRPVENFACTFHTYHTYGAHPPYVSQKSGYEAAKEVLSKVFEKLIDLFNDYKAKGIYDKSMIVVCSDHGNEFAKDEPYRAYPMLWVKGIGENCEFTGSNCPTSHSKIAPLIRKSAAENLNNREIAQILQSKERLYRRIGVGDQRKDGTENWLIFSDGTKKRVEIVDAKRYALWPDK